MEKSFYNNIPSSAPDPVITGLWGFDWRVGRNWGLAHPKGNCYADSTQVYVAEDWKAAQKIRWPILKLGIGENPRTFDIEGKDKLYEYGVQ